ncbi:hypothetical protein FSP39_022572 [Pinctada imbricata]|uniref:Uncharacterized protein n=1 Tax=Pinctada imbricata TaxID=66713 RepID=A0AA89BRV9_PINIB|nr:hypothetical protein FSP39_022572 [Pinctada imbricata]
MAWPGSLKAALGLNLVALFFFVAGFVLPWWFVFDIGSSIYMSVFYALVCGNGEKITIGNCSVISLAGYTANNINNNVDAGNVAESIYYLIIQVVTSSAVGLCFFSSLFLIISACADIRNKCGYVLGAFLLLLSALSSIAVVAVFVILYVTVYTVSDLTINEINFPYSVLAFGLGSLLSFIAFVLICIALCTWRNYDDDDESDEDYPMTAKQQGYSGYNGYDNPRYDDRATRNYQHGHDSRKYDYAYDSRDSRDRYHGGGGHGGSRYDQNNGYPYRQDNMYRPMNMKY